MRRWSHLERQRGASAREGDRETQIEFSDRRMIESIEDNARAAREWSRSASATRSDATAPAPPADAFADLAGKHQRRQVIVVQRIRSRPALYAAGPTVRDARHDHASALWATRGKGSVSLSDTVGFIRDLPHGSVDAIYATRSEAADADWRQRRRRLQPRFPRSRWFRCAAGARRNRRSRRSAATGVQQARCLAHGAPPDGDEGHLHRRWCPASSSARSGEGLPMLHRWVRLMAARD